MAAHASQAQTRNYVELQLDRARARPARGVGHAIRSSPTIRSSSIAGAWAGPRVVLTWPDRPLKIGITCYPSVGGSGILASALGRGTGPARARGAFHQLRASVPDAGGRAAPVFPSGAGQRLRLFKYPDYTLPLSVKMAEVSRDCGLDVLHVHYAVPHATAAILARSMLPPGQQPRVVTTLHGTDTTLLGRDAHYGEGDPPRARALGRGHDGLRVAARGGPAAAGGRAPDRGDPQFLSAASGGAVRGTKCGASWASNARSCCCTCRISAR
jgi:hypothetical protein